jgi:hypothetical protein
MEDQGIHPFREDKNINTSLRKWGLRKWAGFHLVQDRDCAPANAIMYGQIL